MRLPTRIRLLRVPRSRRAELTYPTLTISVVDRNGQEWATPSLGEAIVHLRSNVGARLVIDDDQFQWEGHASDSAPRRPTHMGTTQLVIDRVGDELHVRRMCAGPDNRTNQPALGGDPDYMYDLSVDPPVRTVGRMKASVKDVVVESPHQWDTELPSLQT